MVNGSRVRNIKNGAKKELYGKQERENNIKRDRRDRVQKEKMVCKENDQIKIKNIF